MHLKQNNVLITHTMNLSRAHMQTAYTVHADYGGDAALARLRQRLRAKQLRLIVDFVPNHMAVDHPWARDKAKAYMLMPGTEETMAKEPQVYKGGGGGWGAGWG